MPYYSIYNEDTQLFAVQWSAKKPKGVMLEKGPRKAFVEALTRLVNENIEKRAGKEVVQKINDLNKKGDI